MELWAAMAGAVLGSILTAFLGTMYTRQEREHETKIATTLGLYEEFQSDRMLSARISADNALRTRDGAASFMDLHSTLPPGEWHAVNCIVHFFEKVGILHDAGYLDRKLLDKTLSRYVEYYYANHLAALGHVTQSRDRDQSGWFPPIKRLAIILQKAR